jgi:hypothetical protein
MYGDIGVPCRSGRRAALRLDVMGLRLCVLRPASCVLAVEGLRIDCRLVDFTSGPCMSDFPDTRQVSEWLGFFPHFSYNRVSGRCQSGFWPLSPVPMYVSSYEVRRCS